MEKYQQALSLAKKMGDFKTEADVLRNKIVSEKAYNRDDLARMTIWNFLFCFLNFYSHSLVT